MKTDAFTKTMLAVIAVALAFIAGQGMFKRIEVAHAAAMTTPTYEYKFLIRTFSPDLQTGYAGMNAKWSEDGKQPSDEANNSGGLGARIQQLGSQGWELVGDVAFSQRMNVYPQKSLAANGVTTGDEFIFKRRK